MAKAGTMKNTTGVADDYSPKPKMGRPVGSKNRPPGTAARKTFDYTAYRQTIRRPEDFYAFLEGYPPSTGLLAYIYRLRPSIDFSLIGKDTSYIHTTADVNEMREDFVAARFGRGHYQLKLNDANRPKGQNEVAKTWFDIQDPDVQAPVYDPRTLLLSDPKNQDEVSRLLQTGILVEDSATRRIRLRSSDESSSPVAPPAAAGSPPVAATTWPVSGIGNDMLSQIVLAVLNRGSQNPHDAVKDTIEVAKLLVPAATVSPLNIDEIADRVAVRLGTATVPARTAGEGLFENYERVQKFIDRVRGDAPLRGEVLTDGPAPGKSQTDGESWAPHLAGIIGQIRSALPEVGAMLRDLRVTRENGAGAGVQPPVQQHVVIDPRALPMDQRIEQIATMGFEQMGQGLKGFDFAAWVCTFHPGGLEVYRMLEPAGTVGVIALAAMNPNTRALVNDPGERAKMETFLDDFFSYDPAGGAEESEPSPVPAAAAAGD
jgi:hypothetical protein